MTMKITGYSGIYRDTVGSSPGGVRRRQPRLPSPSQPPSWRHEIPRDPIILPSHPGISRYIPLYLVILPSNPIAPRCAPTMGIPGAKRSRRRRSRATPATLTRHRERLMSIFDADGGSNLDAGLQLELRVLRLKLTHPLQVRGFHSAVARLPLTVGRIRDPVLTAQLLNRHPGIGFFENRNDLRLTGIRDSWECRS